MASFFFGLPRRHLSFFRSLFRPSVERIHNGQGRQSHASAFSSFRFGDDVGVVDGGQMHDGADLTARARDKFHPRLEAYGMLLIAATTGLG